MQRPHLLIHQAAKQGAHMLADAAIQAIAWPYLLLYERETREPLLKILRTSDQSESLQLIEHWFVAKSKEAQYVQVAVRRSPAWRL